MLRVGLTGGIGSGKSVVAAMLAERGAAVIDADRIQREVVEPGSPGLSQVVATFGDGVVSHAGVLNRRKLARIVFADEAQLAKLNAILHPLIRERTAELVAQLPPDAILVHEVPLLVENSMAGDYDLVVAVEAPENVRIERLAERGLSGMDARGRIAAQLEDEDRRAAANRVVVNEGTIDDLVPQIDELWELLQTEAARAGDADRAGPDATEPPAPA